MKNWNILEKSWKLIHDLHMLSFNSMQEFSRKIQKAAFVTNWKKLEKPGLIPDYDFWNKAGNFSPNQHVSLTFQNFLEFSRKGNW